MGTGVDIENQKHTALSCSHCQGTHQESNCPVLPCSRRKEEGHHSLLCPERLAKVRKSKNTEMWIRRQSEAEGSAPVASGGTTSQQSEGTNAENPRRRKSRASPATPTSSDHESVSNDDCDPPSPGANPDSDDEPQDSSTSAEKTQEQEEKPAQCSNCKGPDRKQVCPTPPVRPLQRRRAHIQRLSRALITAAEIQECIHDHEEKA